MRCKFVEGHGMANRNLQKKIGRQLVGMAWRCIQEGRSRIMSKPRIYLGLQGADGGGLDNGDLGFALSRTKRDG